MRFLKTFQREHSFLFKLVLVAVFAVAITVAFSVVSTAMASGGMSGIPFGKRCRIT